MTLTIRQVTMQKKEWTCNIHLTIHDFSDDLMTFRSTESLTTGKDRNCWRFYLGDEIIQHSAFVSTVGNSLCIISTARQSWNPSASMNISPHNHINILNQFFLLLIFCHLFVWVLHSLGLHVLYKQSPPYNWWRQRRQRLRSAGPRWWVEASWLDQRMPAGIRSGTPTWRHALPYITILHVYCIILYIYAII